MKRVVIAVVYAVDVLPGETEQIDTWERATSVLPVPEGMKMLFATNAMAATDRELDDPDFDVDVRAHGRELERIEFP